MVCRECGGELPPAFAGRPRSYCSVTCRQRAYRRRKAGAAATKTTKTTEAATKTTEPGLPDREGEGVGDGGGVGAADPAHRGRAAPRGGSLSAEAIMVRIRLDRGDGPEAPSPALPEQPEGWRTLDDLSRIVLLLAQGLRQQISEVQESAQQEPAQQKSAPRVPAQQVPAQQEPAPGTHACEHPEQHGQP